MHIDSFSKGEWKEMILRGERLIYVDKEDGGPEFICSNVRHWNAPLIKAAPNMYEALEAILQDIADGDITIKQDTLNLVIYATEKADGNIKEKE